MKPVADSPLIDAGGNEIKNSRCCAFLGCGRMS